MVDSPNGEGIGQSIGPSNAPYDLTIFAKNARINNSAQLTRLISEVTEDLWVAVMARAAAYSCTTLVAFKYSNIRSTGAGPPAPLLQNSIATILGPIILRYRAWAARQCEGL